MVSAGGTSEEGSASAVRAGSPASQTPGEPRLARAAATSANCPVVATCRRERREIRQPSEITSIHKLCVSLLRNHASARFT